MKRIWKWLVAVVLVPVLLLAAVAVALQQWVSSADFRDRVAQQLSTALGVRVELGRISVDVWPLPAVALEQVQVKSQPPLSLERVEARPSWLPLLQGRREIATLLVRNAVVPEQALAAIAVAFDRTQRGARQGGRADPARSGPGLLPRRIVLDHLTWVYAKGGSSTADAQVRLDPDGLPGSAKVEVRQGRFQGMRASVTRGDGNWALHADIGGGTVQGPIQIQPGAKGISVVRAQLTTANVELSALTERSRVVTGRLEGQTTLGAELGGPGAIVDSLQSQTRFTVRHAVLHGIDLVQAVKTAGMNRGGETQIDTFAGILVTHGRSVQLNNLVATSGQLSATGNVAMAPDHSLSGRITVDLASRAAAGAIAVPLAVGGTLESPSVMLTQGALLGAAIGTLVAPGVGTGAGASIGDRLGEGLRGLLGK
jgi:uncharacterized protein involved in outer membrane biogenesis